MHVSVLLFAYNCERYLPLAIDSVLAQTHREFELLLIDEGSTDATRARCEHYAGLDRRIRLVSHRGRSPSDSLNRAMRLARHDWVARMEGDDVMLPHRLERQIGFVRAHPGVAVAGSLTNVIDPAGKVVGRFPGPALPTANEFARHLGAGDLIELCHSSILMDRRRVLGVGGYRPEFWPCDDFDLWNRIAETGQPVLVQPEVLHHYRVYPGTGPSAAVEEAWLKAKWVRQCVWDRRAARPEPSFDEMVARHRALPWSRALDLEREASGRLLYKLSIRSRTGRDTGTFKPRERAGAALLDLASACRRLWARRAADRPGTDA